MSTPTPSVTSTCVTDHRIICITGSEQGIPVVIMFIVGACVVLLLAGAKRKRR